jgi:hypothetical protein
VIAAAALLVFVGAGLFVGGLLTGVTALYWACVAVCVVAAVLLVAARRQMPKAPAAGAAPAAPPESSAAASAGPTAAEAAPPVAPAEPAATAVQDGPVAGGATAAGATAVSPTHPAAEHQGDPPVEEVEVTDLLLVLDLKDEVLVVDEHPRYHLAGCLHLAGRTTIPLPLDEARTDGFTPCGGCRPDATLADRVRARKSAGS